MTIWACQICGRNATGEDAAEVCNDCADGRLRRLEDEFNRGYEEGAKVHFAHAQKIHRGIQEIGQLLPMNLGSVIADEAPKILAQWKKGLEEIRDGGCLTGRKVCSCPGCIAGRTLRGGVS